MAKKILIGLISFCLLVIALVAVYWYGKNYLALNQKNLSTEQPLVPTSQTSSPLAQPSIQVVADQLAIPWEIVFLPNGEVIVTERPGTLLLLKDQQKIVVEGVQHVGEGGLLGLAIHPNFEQNHWLYLYLTFTGEQGLQNKVVRYNLDGATLSQPKVIIESIKASRNHDGGRIAFGPDGNLYITTGDAENSNSAQDLGSLNGKILRLTDDGTIPADNPFGMAVYSYGHRNPQGLAWDDQGRLWATEHGRSGVLSGYDELNLIEKGKNYGWPVIQGDQTRDGMVSPVMHSGATTTWAPAGAAFYQGSIYFGGLRGETLYQYSIVSGELKKHFVGEYGRIRAVAVGSDDYLYFTTSNTDGRGSAEPTDDRLIKVSYSSIQ